LQLTRTKAHEFGTAVPRRRHDIGDCNRPVIVLFHPDCNRRLRNHTESADPFDLRKALAGLERAAPYRRWGLSPRPENTLRTMHRRADDIAASGICRWKTRRGAGAGALWM